MIGNHQNAHFANSLLQSTNVHLNNRLHAVTNLIHVLATQADTAFVLTIPNTDLGIHALASISENKTGHEIICR